MTEEKKTEGQKKRGKQEKTDENSGHYVIASSRSPERRPLERRTLAPISNSIKSMVGLKCLFPDSQYYEHFFWGGAQWALM